jgi:tRNA(His) guanylyltransferase
MKLTCSNNFHFNIQNNLQNMEPDSSNLAAPRRSLGSASSLGDRMKSYEAVYNTSLTPSTPTVLRLDGHTFSKFTANFDRPFDPRIHDSMVATCSDLLVHFPSATLAYTQSDEITLVFPSGVGAFNDRVQKITSLAAAYTSVRFNLHLNAAVEASPEPAVRNAEKVLGNAYFDGRLFTIPTVEEALNCVLWRCRGDAVRNSVGAFARTLYTTKELRLKNTGQILDMMKNEKGVVFKDTVPAWALEGTLVKKEQYEHEGKNLKTGEVEMTLRTRTRAVDRGITEASAANLTLITEKYWR